MEKMEEYDEGENSEIVSVTSKGTSTEELIQTVLKKVIDANSVGINMCFNTFSYGGKGIVSVDVTILDEVTAKFRFYQSWNIIDGREALLEIMKKIDLEIDQHLYQKGGERWRFIKNF